MPESSRESAAFPRLDEGQIEALGRFGKRRRFADGEAVFRAGDRDFDFFVVLAGEIEIIEESSGKRNLVAVHQPAEFTGDVDMLTGRPAAVSAFARGECETLAVPAPELRRVISQAPALSDRILQAFLTRRQILEDEGGYGVRVVGSRFSADTHRIREFLAKNRSLFHWIDIETDPEAQTLLEHLGVSTNETPVVDCASGAVLRNPSNGELARCLGIHRPVDKELHDLAIVGAGPAGLAAAVYGASEGLRTLVVDSTGPGGQAGTSSKIENYMGFPMGLSGADLANRAFIQARKFGAEFSVPAEAMGLDCGEGHHVLKLRGGEEVAARCVLIATGASYRRLAGTGAGRFEGNGVYYAATAVESQTCAGADVVVVGGGNSAGQAAMFLSGAARKVWHLIRGGDPAKSMSQYLVNRIQEAPNVELLANTEVEGVDGDGSLGSVRVKNNRTGARTDLPAAALFVFIGADPHTDWLPDSVSRDEKGFVLTGPLAANGAWPLEREPLFLETSCPGVFAAGDVRSNSVKRVASSVGEGSMSVHLVHRFLGFR